MFTSVAGLSQSMEWSTPCFGFLSWSKAAKEAIRSSKARRTDQSNIEEFRSVVQRSKLKATSTDNVQQAPSEELSSKIKNTSNIEEARSKEWTAKLIQSTTCDIDDIQSNEQRPKLKDDSIIMKCTVCIPRLSQAGTMQERDSLQARIACTIMKCTVCIPQLSQAGTMQERDSLQARIGCRVAVVDTGKRVQQEFEVLSSFTSKAECLVKRPYLMQFFGPVAIGRLAMCCKLTLLKLNSSALTRLAKEDSIIRVKRVKTAMRQTMQAPWKAAMPVEHAQPQAALRLTCGAREKEREKQAVHNKPQSMRDDNVTCEGTLAAMQSMELSVKLHIYDVNLPGVQTVNTLFAFSDAPIKFGGVFHAGVEVLGQEWSFSASSGPGLCWCEPKKDPRFKYRETFQMPSTCHPEVVVRRLIKNMSQNYIGNSYDLLRKNCIHFADDLCQQLGCGKIPRWLLRFADIGADTVDFLNWSRRVINSHLNSVGQNENENENHGVPAAEPVERTGLPL